MFLTSYYYLVSSFTLVFNVLLRSWSKYIDDNEERVVRQSLISGKKVYSKFDVANVGFASWRQFITERFFLILFLPFTIIIS